MLRYNFALMMKLIDIGSNLTDPMFRGIYHGKHKHEDDFDNVLKRATDVGVEKMIVTGGSLEDSKNALELSRNYGNLYCTVGCHPTRCGEFSLEPDKYLCGLKNLIKTGSPKVVAIGECGLDYDRLHFCEKSTQLQYFEKQLEMASSIQLPMFLHCRNSHDDFVSLMKKFRTKIKGGVVHSFTGTPQEAKEILSLDLYIGINGCSLKTDANVEAMKVIPSDKILIETDCPWCEIKPSHVGHSYVKTKFPTKKKFEQGYCVKNRSEPCHLIQVLEVVSHIRNEDINTFAEKVYNSTNTLFFNVS